MQNNLAYPDAPGYKDPNGMKAAKELNLEKIRQVHQDILQVIKNLNGATSEEIIKSLWFKRTDRPEDKFEYALHFSDFLGYIEPRISELHNQGKIKPSDIKAKTRRGKTCEVWTVV